jgi:hypothetical protein
MGIGYNDGPELLYLWAVCAIRKNSAQLILYLIRHADWSKDWDFRNLAFECMRRGAENCLAVLLDKPLLTSAGFSENHYQRVITECISRLADVIFDPETDLPYSGVLTGTLYTDPAGAIFNLPCIKAAGLIAPPDSHPSTHSQDLYDAVTQHIKTKSRDYNPMVPWPLSTATIVRIKAFQLAALSFLTGPRALMIWAAYIARM